MAFFSLFMTFLPNDCFCSWCGWSFRGGGLLTAGAGVGVGVGVGVAVGVGVDAPTKLALSPLHQRAASTPEPRIAISKTIPAIHRFDFFTGRVCTGTFTRLITGWFGSVEGF